MTYVGNYLDLFKEENRIKGKYQPFKRSDGTYGITYCCPSCGEISAGTDNHIFNWGTHSVTPSIVHKCGFHGWLKDGFLR